MELTLQVNDDVARKIRGLSVLTGKSANEITQDIGDHIDGLITSQIIESVGGPRPAHDRALSKAGATITSLHPALLKSRQDSEDVFEILEDDEEEVEIYNPAFEESEEDTEDSLYEDEDEEIESAAEGLSNITEEDVEEMDDELPQAFFEEEQEEEEVSIKDKDGKETGYDDELMADIQAMAEDFEDEESGLVSEDPALAAASNKRKGATISTLSDNAHHDVGDESLDVLPTDFDIDNIAGNDSGAKDFFTKAFSGETGDKTKRNQVRRKVIKKV